MTDQQALEYARDQHMRAKSGEADNQCPTCGMFRLDGKPAVLHRDGCDHAEDWKADPLYVLDRP